LYVPFVIKAMAKILNIDENILQKQIYTNTINLFKVSF
jgi:Tat protein secretion system quality control protein TatD with DNase activity